MHKYFFRSRTSEYHLKNLPSPAAPQWPVLSKLRFHCQFIISLSVFFAVTDTLAQQNKYEIINFRKSFAENRDIFL